MGVNIRNVGAAMRGMGDAATLYDEQERKRAAERFAVKQRAEQEQAWQRDALLRAGEAQIKPEGESAEVAPNDPYGEHVTGKTIKRGIGDVQTDRAAMLQRLGRGTEAAQARAAGMQLTEAEQKLSAKTKRDLLAAKYAGWKQRMLKDDYEWAGEAIDHYNVNVPDGYRALWGSGADGSKTLAFFNEKTGKVEGDPQIIGKAQMRQRAAELLQQLQDAEMSGVDYETGESVEKRGIARDTLRVKKGELGVQQGKLGVDQGKLRIEQENAPAQRGYWADLGGAARTNAGANAARVNLDTYQPGAGSIQFNPETNQYEHVTPVTNRRTGDTRFNTQAVPPGMVPAKQSNPRPPHVQAAVDKVAGMIERGVLDPANTDSVRAVYSTLGVNPDEVMGKDPLIEALKNHKRGGKQAAPAAAPAAKKTEEKKRGIPTSPGSTLYVNPRAPSNEPARVSFNKEK